MSTSPDTLHHESTTIGRTRPASDLNWPLSSESIIEVENAATLRITVHFLKGSIGYSAERRDVVLNSIKKHRAQNNGRETWEHWANVNFEDVASDEADIRVGFNDYDGSWSHIGRSGKNHKGVTLNLCGIGARLPPPENDFGTILHLFGHALGLHHEFAGSLQDLDVSKMRCRCSGKYPRRLYNKEWKDRAAITNLSNFDPDSIMMCQINPVTQQPNNKLSRLDKAFIMLDYPPDLRDHSDKATEERLSHFETAIRDSGLEIKAGEILHAFLDPTPILDLESEENPTLSHRLQAVRKCFREYHSMRLLRRSDGTFSLTDPALSRQLGLTDPLRDVVKDKLFRSLVKHAVKNSLEQRSGPIRQSIPGASPIEVATMMAAISVHEQVARYVKAYRDDLDGSVLSPAHHVRTGELHPVDIEQCILDFLRMLKTRGGLLSPITPGSNSDQLNDIVPALLEYIEVTESGGSSQGPVTTGEWSDLQERLTQDFNRQPDNDVPLDVQRGLLTKLPGVQKLLDWFSNTVSESRTDVRRISSATTDKMLEMLQKSPPQDIFQEVYHLCFASYYMHDVNGTAKDLQTKYQQLLDSLLPMIIRTTEATPNNGWQLVWGPVIWKVKPGDKSGGPDLAWYIAYNDSVVCGDDDESRPTYVIAIAGTQTRSVHTWLNSNFDVTFPIDFKSWMSNLRSNPYELRFPTGEIDQESPYLARGTARTVWQLLTVPAPPGAKSEGQPLLGFLQSESQSHRDLRIITTGHSLGGALSPALAAVLNEFDITPRDRILTYPIAGPSPGNHAFASLFSATFPPIPASEADLESRRYQVWNFNIVNAHDPVPQAWCSDKQACPRQNLLNITHMIPGASYIKTIISAVVSSVLGDLSDARVRYMPIRSQIFSLRPSGTFKEVRPQHTEAYHEYVGITPPHLQDALR